MVTEQGVHTKQYVNKGKFFAHNLLNCIKREKSFKIIHALIPMSMKRS
jgi:hypothetical protein